MLTFSCLSISPNKISCFFPIGISDREILEGSGLIRYTRSRPDERATILIQMNGLQHPQIPETF